MIRRSCVFALLLAVPLLAQLPPEKAESSFTVSDGLEFKIMSSLRLNIRDDKAKQTGNLQTEARTDETGMGPRKVKLFEPILATWVMTT